MATEIKLPPLGENIDSATVTRILVAAGDKISEGQSVLEVDTDKASVDVPADASGAVDAIRVKEGDVIKVGQVLLTLRDGSSASPPAPPAQPAKAETAKPQEKSAPPPDLEKTEEPEKPEEAAAASAPDS